LELVLLASAPRFFFFFFSLFLFNAGRELNLYLLANKKVGASSRSRRRKRIRTPSPSEGRARRAGLGAWASLGTTRQCYSQMGLLTWCGGPGRRSTLVDWAGVWGREHARLGRWEGRETRLGHQQFSIRSPVQKQVAFFFPSDRATAFLLLFVFVKFVCILFYCICKFLSKFIYSKSVVVFYLFEHQIYVI
jgi:hypothetical protein